MVDEEIRHYASHHRCYMQDSEPRGSPDGLPPQYVAGPAGLGYFQGGDRRESRPEATTASIRPLRVPESGPFTEGQAMRVLLVALATVDVAIADENTRALRRR